MCVCVNFQQKKKCILNISFESGCTLFRQSLRKDYLFFVLWHSQQFGNIQTFLSETQWWMCRICFYYFWLWDILLAKVYTWQTTKFQIMFQVFFLFTVLFLPVSGCHFTQNVRYLKNKMFCIPKISAIYTHTHNHWTFNMF